MVTYQVWVHVSDWPTPGINGWKMVAFFDSKKDAGEWLDDFHRHHGFADWKILAVMEA